ncbi:hypothetical protein ACHAQA_001753 [Verticillium albo-atrum]
MAPSLFTLCTLALAFVGDASATKFYLDDTYDHKNFFDKFNFFESRYGTGNYNDVDPTSGYINYRKRSDAEALGLIQTRGEEIYMGVDHHTVTKFPGVGRDSVRIESKAIYNKGLFIARFTHLPKPVCGAWPALPSWSYGDPWPKVGELDFYEGWNEQPVNKPAAHTYDSYFNGTCTISPLGQTAAVSHYDCDNFAGQWDNQGCTTVATSADPWGSAQGGIYAVEWTTEYIKFFSWRHGAEPANVNSATPDTAAWGKPSVLIANNLCNVDSHFADQKLVLNIDFCGVTAGNPYIWGPECSAKTHEQECSSYVAKNPTAFKDVYWQIKDIRVFTETEPVVVSSSSAVASSSTVESSSVIPSSSYVPSSSAVSESSYVAESSSAPASSVPESSAISASSIPASSIPASSIPASSIPASSIAAASSVLASSEVSASVSASASESSSFPASSSGRQAPEVPPSSAVSEVSSIPVSSSIPASSTVSESSYASEYSYAPESSHVSASYISRIGHVTTEVIALYTTVCPVAVSTKTIKRIHEVTSCPPEVPSTACPYGSKTTETITTTITRVLDGSPTAYVEQPKRPSGGEVPAPKPSSRVEDDEQWHDVSEGEYVTPGGGPRPGKPHAGNEYPSKHDAEHESPAPTKHVYETATVIVVPVPAPSVEPGHNVTVPVHDDKHVHPPNDEEEKDDYPGVEANGAVRMGSSVLALMAVAAVAIAL